MPDVRTWTKEGWVPVEARACGSCGHLDLYHTEDGCFYPDDPRQCDCRRWEEGWEEGE